MTLILNILSWGFEMELNEREIAITTVALRFLQANVDEIDIKEVFYEHFYDQSQELTTDEIEQLCEKISSAQNFIES
ncbi:hypothetical protein [Aetokthonos hydrillicola]|nr:hypothetical protein [Aetokthonos hydrillicola CCALA 1050]MBW4590985.1 hypothetical protein [Aetokthonos hydrillicola CCALA 1050]